MLPDVILPIPEVSAHPVIVTHGPALECIAVLHGYGSIDGAGMYYVEWRLERVEHADWSSAELGYRGCAGHRSLFPEIIPDAEICVCGREYLPDDAQDVDGEPHCARCAQDAYRCDYCGERHSEDHGDYRITLCESCRDDYAACDDCDRLVRDGDMSSYCDRNVCSSCAENYFTCDSCGEEYHIDDFAGDGYCTSCYSGDDEDGAHTCKPGMRVIGETFDEIRSKRCFGVELEFSAAPDAGEVAYQSRWGACEDGTSGVAQEYYSPILQGDQGLASVRAFCRAAVDHEVSSACGFHLHLDMRGEKPLALTRIALAYQLTVNVWQCFVPESRRRNMYCAANQDNAQDIATGRYKPHAKSDYTRYWAINWEAYKDHRTVEIRLHTGTCDARKVCNWIKAHTRFCDYAKRVPIETLLALQSASRTERFAFLVSAWADPELTEYYRQRARNFGTIL